MLIDHSSTSVSDFYTACMESERAPLSVRERNKRHTRDHLRDVATALFIERGFAATSVEDIVTAAGASRATFYAHFTSKEAVLGEIVEVMWTEAEEHYIAFGKLEDWSRASLLEWLRDFGEHWRRTADRNRAATEAAFALMLAEGPEWRRRHVQAVLSPAERWSHFTKPEAALRASMLVRVVVGELANYFFGSRSLDFEVFIGYLADGVRDLLRAP